MTYSSIKFQLYAVVNDITVDVVQCSCSYGLNGIPKATLVLPVGINLTTLRLSYSHTIASNTSIQVPVQIYVRVLPGVGLGNDHAIVPEGLYKLFDGYSTGVGYRRTSGSLSIALELTHWLSDLNFSSTLSASSHPGNPYTMTFNAFLVDTAVDAGAAGISVLPHWTGRTRAQTLATDAKVLEDLWGNVILKWFLSLTEVDRLLMQPEAFGREVANNDSKNGEAKAALEKFDGTTLELDLDIATEQKQIASAIREDLAASMHNGASNTNHFAAIANTTLWNKLVGDLCQRYMFSVVPFPESAKVVPFIAGLRTEFNARDDDDYTIMSRDIISFDLNSYLPRPLRAVGIYGGHSSIGGTDMRIAQDVPTLQEVSGMFIGRDEGLVMYKAAPQWAVNIGTPWINTVSSAGVGTPRSSMFDPKIGDEPETGSKDSIRRLRSDLSGILDKYAQAMYAQEMLKNRMGQLSGAVRFDIAPGSTISIEGQGDTFTDDGVVDVRYATAIGVTYYFDAEAQAAGTAFRLAHIRSEGENELQATSIEKHPLYKAKWTGAELVEKIDE
jgi:hypothetical protein